MLLTATVARFLLNEEFGLSTASSHHDFYSLPLGAASAAAWTIHQLTAEEFSQAGKPKCFWSLVMTLARFQSTMVARVLLSVMILIHSHQDSKSLVVASSPQIEIHKTGP